MKPNKPPIEARPKLYGWRHLRFERWQLSFRGREGNVLYGIKILRWRFLFGYVKLKINPTYHKKDE